VRVISGNHFHQNNDGSGDKTCGDGDKVCGDGDNFMGLEMGMLCHPRVTL